MHFVGLREEACEILSHFNSKFETKYEVSMWIGPCNPKGQLCWPEPSHLCRSIPPSKYASLLSQS